MDSLRELGALWSVQECCIVDRATSAVTLKSVSLFFIWVLLLLLLGYFCFAAIPTATLKFRPSNLFWYTITNRTTCHSLFLPHSTHLVTPARSHGRQMSRAGRGERDGRPCPPHATKGGAAGLGHVQQSSAPTWLGLAEADALGEGRYSWVPSEREKKWRKAGWRLEDGPWEWVSEGGFDSPPKFRVSSCGSYWRTFFCMNIHI